MGVAGAQVANAPASADAAGLPGAPAAQSRQGPPVSVLPSTGELAPAAGVGLGLGIVALAIGLVWARQRRATI
jgi:LPXTG-motif cell wall-anchored protein